MPSEFPRHDPQNVWQNQPTEVFKMSLENLRRKADRLDRKARWVVFLSAALAAFLFPWFGWAFLSFPEKFQAFHLDRFGAWSTRLGFAVISLWGLYNVYETFKVFWPNPAASDAGLTTTLHSYRLQLEKRRDYAQKVWLRSGLLVCFLGVAMVLIPALVRDIATPLRLVTHLGPIFALLILWLAFFIPGRKRKLRQLQVEIDQLQAFESEYQA